MIVLPVIVLRKDLNCLCHVDRYDSTYRLIHLGKMIFVYFAKVESSNDGVLIGRIKIGCVLGPQHHRSNKRALSVKPF